MSNKCKRFKKNLTKKYNLVFRKTFLSLTKAAKERIMLIPVKKG